MGAASQRAHEALRAKLEAADDDLASPHSRPPAARTNRVFRRFWGPLPVSPS